ncbi:uncharacterized protein LOC126339003 [Schistocerca gregaria]|uniref:uncharacterized protein LOC126339003 n=1 Tax=Schistocerca gregaria TaxID=7010 RepID=UPI00211EB211|nr:uncharacterized protein LOC126339003 [Schistocerca gregaria]
MRNCIQPLEMLAITLKEILELMRREKDAEKELSSAVRRLVRCELRMLAAICPPQLLQNGRACFTADAIIDSVHSVIEADVAGEAVEDDAVRLYFLNERFMDHFEDMMEDGHSLIGSKVVDILDCCVVCDYELVVSKSDGLCRIAGVYQTGKLSVLEHPPAIQASSSGDSRGSQPAKQDLRSFLRYLRNTVRWNNLLDCLDKGANQTKNKRKAVTLRNGAECGGNSAIVQKILKRHGHRQTGDPSFSITLDLKCVKQMSPLRLQSMEWLPNQTTEKKENSGYDFNLEMKVKCIQGESCLQIFQSTKECLVVQNNCKCC